MKSVSRKIIALLLAAVMMLGMGVVAFAEDAAEDAAPEETAAEDAVVVFTTDPLEDGTFAIVAPESGKIADDGIFNIPASYIYNDAEYTITKIGGYAFNYNETIPETEFLKDVTTLVISDGIKEIGEYAFRLLPALTEVIFEGDIILDEGVFSGCELLKKVTFKGSADVGAFAFENCPELETIEAASDKTYNVARTALTDTKWYKNYSVDFVTLGTTLIEYKGKDEEETIPLNITAIGASAFEGNTTLKKIVFTKYVDTLGDRAFANCSALKEVVFSDFGEIKNIGVDVFAGTPYYNDFDGEFFAIGNVLIKYRGKDVSHVIIPNTITTIAPDCFEGCYVSYDKSKPESYSFVISSILVPASVTEFGEDCFILARFSDGETYSPRIYAYAGTPAAEALEAAGYLITPMQYKTADLDQDGKITSADARLCLRLAVGLEEPDEFFKYAADVDGDGAVTSADARLILRIAVGLEEYTIEDLLNIPKTKFEVMHAYENAVKLAAKYNMGYTKVVSNKIAASDINNAHSKKLLSVAEKNAVNQTYVYLKDNQVSIDALPSLKLQNTNLVKAARCEARDGKYYITIRLYDVLDDQVTVDAPEYNGGTPYIASMIPVVPGNVFYESFAANKWWKLVPNSDNLSPNCVRKYALTYNNPTINAVVNKDTGKLESVVLSVGYHFALDGRINGLDISSKGFKTGDATIDRLDTVTYCAFN